MALNKVCVYIAKDNIPEATISIPVKKHWIMISHNFDFSLSSEIVVIEIAKDLILFTK